MEKIVNQNFGSELAPSYPGITAYQMPVIPEPESYPATTPTFASELPPSYPSSSSAISQSRGTTQHTTVPVVTSQPSRVTLPSTTSGNIKGAAYTILALSVCSCMICFVFGSPLTIFCLVPAILLAMLVKCEVECVYISICCSLSCSSRSSKTVSLNAGESVCIQWKT